MNTILLNKPRYSSCKGQFWTKTVGLLALIIILAPFKAQAQNQTFCAPATVSNLANPGPTGFTGQWFADASGGTALAPTTALATGIYYAEQNNPISIATLGSGFRGSTGIAVQADGKIIVADFQNNLVKRMNADGTGIETLGSGFSQPISVTVEASGTILIAEFSSSVIKRMSADGTVITTVASGFNFPGGVTVQSDGKILVANQGANTVVRMNADGTGMVVLGSGFNRPYATLIELDGKIIVADAGNNVIKRMDADGTNIATLATGFSSPRRIAIQADGKILIADFGNSAIKRMNADGTRIVTLGSGFGNTFGVAFESTGKILVADFSNAAIKRITEETATRTAVNVTVNTTPVPTRNMSITGTLCNGATIGTLISKFNNSTNVKCYAAATGGSPLADTDLIAPVNASVTFYLTQTINGCESERLAYTAVVNFITPPNAAPNQNFCSGATVANLEATPGTRGNSSACCLNWFTSPSGGSALASSTALISGTYYVGQQDISGCAIERTMVTVTLEAEDLDSPTVTSPQIYAGTATIANLTAPGNNLQWYENSTARSFLPTTTTLVDGATYYVSQSNACGESPRSPVTVKKISEASQNLCAGATVSDLVATPSAENIVQWFDSNKGTTPLADASTLTAGTYYVEQVAPAFITTLPVSYNTDGGMALQQDGKIVLADYNSIKRINANGSNLETLLSLPSSYIADVAVQQDGKIIFTDYNAGSIKRINADGTNLETVISGLVNPTFIAIQSDGKIIFVADLGIYSVNANGTGLVLIRGGSASFGANITDIAIQQDGKILYPVAGNGAVLRMDADGTNNILFYQEQNSFFYGLSVQNDGKIIATDIFNGGRIIRLNADGTNLVTLASNIGGNAYGILAEPNGTILFTDTSTSTPLKRINKGLPSNRVPVTVNITPKTNNVTNIAACGSYYWSVNEQTYTSSGTYTFVNGCATETLNATITPNTESVLRIVECDSYTWPVNGETYTTSGTYTFVNGCDTKKLQLTITPTTTNTRTQTACTSFFWTNTGQTYTTTGLYTGRTTNCIKEILDLTIVSSSENTTTLSACGSYIWNGQTYTQSGTYTGITTNCVTEKLVLTIIPSSDNVTTASACESYTWNGQTYTQSGTYTGTTTNCVTEKLVLTIVPNSDNVTTITACDSYTWNGQTYTQSGTYTGTTTNCVTEKLVLTINDSINSSVSLSGDTLKSNASSGTYQWIDCNNSNQPIVGETNQTFTPKQPGSYAVIVTQNSCSVTSNCQVISVLGNDTFEKEELRYFPNPTAGILNVAYSEPMTEIAVMNILGQTVLTLKPNSNEAQLDLSRLSSNTYLIKLTTEGKSKIIRVIKN